MPSIENTLTNYKSSSTACLFLLPDAPKFTIVDANDAYLRLTGKTLGELIGRNLFEAFPEHHEEVNNKRVKALRNAVENTFRLKKPSKLRLQRYDVAIGKSTGLEVKFWNSDTIPVLDENGKVLFLVHTAVDVTEFVNQQSATPQADAMFYEEFTHPLFNDYPDGVATLDLYGNFLSVNKIFVDQSRFTKEDLLSMSFVRLITEKDFSRVFDLFQKGMKGEIQNFEAEMVNGAGMQMILNLTFLPILVNNEVLGIYMIVKDLTALKEAKLQVEAHQAQLINILESITDGFFAVDHDWTITYWNKEAERILRAPREQVIGRNLWDVYPEAVPLKFFEEYKHAMENQVSVRFDEFLPSLDLWLEITVYPNNGGLAGYFRDATSRVKAEEEIRNAKARYQNLFDFSPFPIWVYDIRTLKFLAINASAITTYGYSEAELLDMTIRDMYPAEEQESLDELIRSKMIPGQVNRTRIRLVKKSGEVLTVEIDSQPLTSWNETAGIIVAQDVTDKIRAEEALIASEQRFRALVQDGSDLTGILDLSGIFKYVSPSTKRVLGIDSVHLMDKNIFEFIHPEDKATFLEDFRTLSIQKSKHMAPFRVVSGVNQYRWIEASITDMSDDTTVCGIIINAREVTQRINNERKIKASIEHYNRISRAGTDAIYDWDLHTNELKWSKGFEQVFGFDAPEAASRKARWLELIHPEDQSRVIDELFLHLRDKKVRWKQQYRFLTAGGVYKAVLDRGFFVFDRDGEPERMIGAMQDITERLTFLSNMELENRMLKEISWMQSHIVRAPLARIMGLSELLTYNEGKITNKELLVHLTDSAHELDQVISSILSQTDKKGE